MPEGDIATTGRRPIYETLRSLPLGLSAAFFGFVLLVKVYAVAHYSLTTTTALASAAPGLVFLGTLASYAYALVGCAGFFSLYVWFRSGRTSLGLAWSVALLTVFLVLTLLTPWPYWWPVGLIFVAVVVTNWAHDVRQAPPVQHHREQVEDRSLARRAWDATGRMKEHAERWLRRRSKKAAVIANLAVLLAGAGLLTKVLLPTLDQPWLPAEVITFTQREVIAEHTSPTNDDPATAKVVTGYVFSSQDGWTQILVAKSRFVMRVRNEEIADRRICRYDENILNAHPTLLQTFKGEDYYSPNRVCKTVKSNMKKDPAR